MCRRRGLLVAWVVLAGCRSADKPGISELNVDKTWYDQAGAVQSCEAPPAACTVYKDQKSFVDVCVAKGFQAKTCGCLLVCSGKIGGYGAVDDAVSRKAGSPAVDSCATADQTIIKSAAKARVAGGSLDRCLSAHVCNGNLGWCTGSDRVISGKLRDLAKHGCASLVLETFCPDGYQETLACPEATIQNLSETWSQFQKKDDTVKRCLRNVICSDSKASCDAASFQRGSALKQAVNQDGCEYWLRAYCAIGAHAW